jgi:hypothetical protein
MPPTVRARAEIGSFDLILGKTGSSVIRLNARTAGVTLVSIPSSAPRR